MDEGEGVLNHRETHLMIIHVPREFLYLGGEADQLLADDEYFLNDRAQIGYNSHFYSPRIFLIFAIFSATSIRADRTATIAMSSAESISPMAALSSSSSLTAEALAT